MSAPLLPGLDRRDGQITELLDRGLSVDRVAEMGVYRGNRTRPAWTRDDVERVALDRATATATASKGCRCAVTDWQPPAAGETRPVMLTRRQAQVLDGLCEGLTTGRIADRLDVSEWTVKSQVSDVLKKLGAKSQAQAVAYALGGKVRIVVRDQRAT